MYDDYSEIRKQAEERVKKREKAKEDMEGFFLIDGFLWALWLIAFFTGVADNIANHFIIPLVVLSFIWGISAIGTWYEETYGNQEREERIKDEVEKEIERELAKHGRVEKRKRLSLSDDGELVEILEDEHAPVKNQLNE